MTERENLKHITGLDIIIRINKLQKMYSFVALTNNFYTVIRTLYSHIVYIKYNNPHLMSIVH